jgi:hypothetical protein
MSSIASSQSKGRLSFLRLFGFRDYVGGTTTIVLVLIGIVTIFMGIQGGNTVVSNLKTQQIVGSADMTPAGIMKEAQQAGLKVAALTIPTCSVANKAVNSGSSARCFAQYMQIHTLEATGGFYYSQMGQFTAIKSAPKVQLTPDGATNNPLYAATDPKTHQPVANGARNIWVTETALTGSLNMSYMASQLALFSIAVGVALFLTGIGLGIAGYRRKA